MWSALLPLATSLLGIGGKSATGGGGFGGWLKKLDPTGVLLGGLSLLGGDPGPQRRISYDNPGQMEDPVQALRQALSGSARLGQGIQERAPLQLRSSYVQAPPKPVQIPGIPFQIGGGLGTDPALADPSLLQEQPGRRPFQYDPMQSLDAAGVKRRTPPAGGSNG